MNLMNIIENEHIKKYTQSQKNISFNTGDVLSVKIINSKTKKRKQNLIGVCIAKKNRGINSSFTIRTVLNGEGVEHTFPLYSPLVQQVQVLFVKNMKTKRLFKKSKLYYLRKYPSDLLFSINMHNR